MEQTPQTRTVPSQPNPDVAPQPDAAKDAQPKKKLGCLKIFLIFLAALVLAYVVLRLVRDRKLETAQVASFGEIAALPEGVAPDCRALFNALQDEDALPADDNGWKLIIKTLGPAALEQRYLVDTVPWEDFPTADASKEWFANYWTPLCEKFGLDPFEKPEMFGRPALNTYLKINGITGEEPIPEPEFEDLEYETFLVDGKQQLARVSDNEISRLYDSDKVWTKEDAPVAARWLEENADLYDVFTKAARMPKFRCAHFVDDQPFAFVRMLLPDVQHMREIARLLRFRACYRIGAGDIAGAIEDAETILLMSRSVLESKNPCLVELLVGIALHGVAADIPFFANGLDSVDPADLERLQKLWEPLDAKYFEKCYQKGMDAEYLFSCSIVQDFLTTRRSGDAPVRALAETLRGPEPTLGFSAPLDLILNVAPFDDARALKYFNEFWNAAQDQEEYEKLRSKYATSLEGRSVAMLFDTVRPAVDACRAAFKRAACVRNEKMIQIAFARYYSDNGKLPPAFTVGDSNYPMHSWRVLLLPYLGEDAQAIYNLVKLDKAWDSEENAALRAMAPDVFCCPAFDDVPGNTGYAVYLGNDGLFDQSGQGHATEHALPKAALFLETPNRVNWMAPVGSLIDSAIPLLVQEPAHSGAFNCALLDGSVRVVSVAGHEKDMPGILAGRIDPYAIPEENVFETDSETDSDEPTEN